MAYLEFVNHATHNSPHNWNGPYIWSFTNLEIHFNNEQATHTSLINYEESGYGYNLFV